MEAARVSALRGHKVTLWERTGALGGNLIPAAVPAFKDDYKLLIDYLRTQIRKLKVTVEFGKEGTPELIQQFGPDAVFIATGATPIIPEVEGIEKAMKTGRVVTAVDALLGKKELAEAVIVMGAGLIGCETALHLAQRGKKVTIAGGRRLAHDLVWGNALDLIKLLDDHHVRIFRNNHIRSLGEGGADSASHHFEGDSMVLAVGMKSIAWVSPESLEGKVREVYTIGDCVRPRHVLDAMWEGYRTAYVI